MSNLKGDLRSIRKLSESIRTMPFWLARAVARNAAAAITKEAQASYDSGQDPYGVDWAPSAEGDRVDLNESGAMRSFVEYVAVGSKMRMVLGVPYAKYQVGKRPIGPRQGAPLPKNYIAALERAIDKSVREEALS